MEFEHVLCRRLIKKGQVGGIYMDVFTVSQSVCLFTASIRSLERYSGTLCLCKGVCVSG